MLLVRKEDKKKPIRFDRLDVRQLVRDLGIQTKGVEGGWITAWCVFHDDGTNPNMRISLNGAGYKCFSCGASGGAVDLTMRSLHVDRDHALDYLRGERPRSIKPDDLRAKLAAARNRVQQMHGQESVRGMLTQISVALTFVYPDSHRSLLVELGDGGDLEAATRYTPSTDLYTAWEWVDYLHGELEMVQDDIDVDSIAEQVDDLLAFISRVGILPCRVVLSPRHIGLGVEIPSEVVQLRLPAWGTEAQLLPFATSAVVSEEAAKRLTLS